MELRRKIELELDGWDREFGQREQSFLDTSDTEKRLKEEEEQINKSLDEIVSKFDELLNIMGKKKVEDEIEEKFDSATQDKIIGLGRIIYEEAMLALHLTRDHDILKDRRLIPLKDNPEELNKYIPIDSLKKKVKAHFILAELYSALKVRLDPEINDRSASAEYKKVISEGKLLYERLKKDKDHLERMKVAYEVGASHKRLFDLFVDDKEKSGKKYGAVKKGDSFETDPDFQQAKNWYNKMFDIQNENPDIFFDSQEIFHTEYEFGRYLKDIEVLKGVGCAFQTYKKREVNNEVCKYLQCSKKGKECSHNRFEKDNEENKIKNSDECTLSINNSAYYKGLIARVELRRDIY